MWSWYTAPRLELGFASVSTRQDSWVERDTLRVLAYTASVRPDCVLYQVLLEAPLSDWEASASRVTHNVFQLVRNVGRTPVSNLRIGLRLEAVDSLEIQVAPNVPSRLLSNEASIMFADNFTVAQIDRLSPGEVAIIQYRGRTPVTDSTIINVNTLFWSADQPLPSMPTPTWLGWPEALAIASQAAGDEALFSLVVRARCRAGVALCQPPSETPPGPHLIQLEPRCHKEWAQTSWTQALTGFEVQTVLEDPSSAFPPQVVSRQRFK